jgi:hypothetical protein
MIHYDKNNNYVKGFQSEDVEFVNASGDKSAFWSASGSSRSNKLWVVTQNSIAYVLQKLENFC